MPNNLSTYLADKLLDHLFQVTNGGLAYRPTTTGLYLGLSTSNPTNTGDQSGEPSGNGYARQPVYAGGTWSGASGESTANLNEIDFPQATGNWGTVGHAFIADAITGGNILWQGSLVNSKTVTTNDIMSFGIGALTAGLS